MLELVWAVFQLAVWAVAVGLVLVLVVVPVILLVGELVVAVQGAVKAGVLLVKTYIRMRRTG